MRRQRRANVANHAMRPKPLNYNNNDDENDDDDDDNDGIHGPVLSFCFDPFLRSLRYTLLIEPLFSI